MPPGSRNLLQDGHFQEGGRSGVSRWRLIAAFGAIYGIWGSTYLAIRVAVEAMPPLLMMGARSLLAGAVLYAWARLRDGERPAPGHWRGAFQVGALLFLVCHGGLSWAETRVPSGIAALLFSTTAIWMTVLGGGGGRRAPLALALGTAGVAFLVGPSELVQGDPVDLAGAGVLLVGALAWTVGSIRSQRIERPASTILATGMDLLAGGALLLLAGILLGEPARLGPDALALRPMGALLYLVVFGSIVAFTSYTWLLRNAAMARISSYVYVNPLVAVALGWAAAGEPLSPRVAAAAAILILAVVFLVTGQPSRSRGMEPPGTFPAARRPEEAAARDRS